MRNHEGMSHNFVDFVICTMSNRGMSSLIYGGLASSLR
jgi:hypothetical protein